ncbi:MAG: hypothetical protein MPN21_02575 [Thermoanaerobaculia bacterium]|nr:hypothetical protein [Thermoanaerobaculia bacterium]
MRQQAREARGVLTVGFVAAAVVLAVPFLGFVFSYLGILIHETGHTLTAWLFGYPAVPAFDFRYGGGVSIYQTRSSAVLLVLALGALWALWTAWQLPRWRRVVATVLGLWVLLIVTPLHQMTILAMGHGFELMVAGLFLYKAASGRGFEIEAERPAYAFAGWFLVLFNARFAWRLVASPEQRQLYGAAKGGGHWMDFSVLARDFLGISLQAVSGLYLVLVLTTPLLAFLAARRADRWRDALERWVFGD